MFNLENIANAFKWMLNLKGDLLKTKSLEYIVIVALSVALVFGLAVFLIDPNIHSLSDGIWYAWVSLTHVGYGDVIPSSLLGRVLGAFLIFFGLAMFALITACVSAALIGKDIGGVQEVQTTQDSLVLQDWRACISVLSKWKRG